MTFFGEHTYGSKTSAHTDDNPGRTCARKVLVFDLSIHLVLSIRGFAILGVPVQYRKLLVFPLKLGYLVDLSAASAG